MLCLLGPLAAAAIVTSDTSWFAAFDADARICCSDSLESRTTLTTSASDPVSLPFFFFFLELIEQDLDDASETGFDDGQLGALLTDCDLIDSACRIDRNKVLDKESSLQSTLIQLGI